MRVGQRAGVGIAVIALGMNGQNAHGQTTIELPADDRALSTDFEEVYRVGSFDGDLWETFGEITGLSFDAAGNLFILDRQASQVTPRFAGEHVQREPRVGVSGVGGLLQISHVAAAAAEPQQAAATSQLVQ